MKCIWSASLAAVLWMYAVAGHAQVSILPPPCKGKAGEALDNCVREITPPQRSSRVDPVEQKVDPKQLINCETVNAADQTLCVWRNQIILDCRKRQKHPDPDRCLADAMGKPPVPQVANCTPLAPQQKSACFQRNKTFKDCLADPLRYFICVSAKTERK